MSNSTFKLFADKMGGTAATSYIGTQGELFYDQTFPVPGYLRISDGVTPGGLIFAGQASTGSISYDPQFTDSSGTLAGVTYNGTYVKQGFITHFRVSIDFSGATNLGTGQYQFILPSDSAATVTVRGGTLHQTANGGSKYHIAGITDIDESHSIMKLYYSGSVSDLAWKYNTPVSATSNTSHFDITGAYQTTT